MHSVHTPIEILENRIAPAGVVTFTDVDGDIVKVTSTKGTTAQLESALTIVGGQLQKIDLTDLVFNGTNLSVFVVPQTASGDGFVNVGFIDATDFNLGTVLVRGDLGKLAAGRGGATPAVALLTVNSLGAQGTATGAPDLQTLIEGGLGGLRVLGDVDQASVVVEGPLGNVFIAGDLIGGSAANSGEIAAFGPSIGNVKIDGDIVGGSGGLSGSIRFDQASKNGTITIGGSIEGGTGFSGRIAGGKSGAIFIGGDLEGGAGSSSGVIEFLSATAVTVGGNVVGSSGGGSGSLRLDENSGAIKIAGSIQGGEGVSSGLLRLNGKTTLISVGGSIAVGATGKGGQIIAKGTGRFTLGGSLVEGFVSLGRVGTVLVNGSIIGGSSIPGSGTLHMLNVATLKIVGDVTGTQFPVDGGVPVGSGVVWVESMAGTIDIGGGLSGATVSVGGGGSNPPAAGNVLTRLTVSGSVEQSLIEAGRFSFADVKVGAVVVKGDWIASSLLIGARNLGADDAPGGTGLNEDNLKFGDAHDALNEFRAKTAIIANIVIGGTVSGTPDVVNADDHFGFVAKRIGTFRVGGVAVPLATGPGNDNISIGTTGDVRIHEVN
jgi:hypothetical protein